MRREKFELIFECIQELKTIKSEINKRPKKKFITSVPYLYTLNNGMIIPREKILKNGIDGSAVIVAPHIEEIDEYLVTIEPRVFTNLGVAVSFPAGYIEKGETPKEAAIRELREETGYVSNELIKLDSFYQDEGASAAYNSSFLALGCEKKYEQKLDQSEIVRYTTLNLDELLELEKDGIISGSNTKLTLSRIKEWKR